MDIKIKINIVNENDYKENKTLINETDNKIYSE
jgi:hypothetical protein